MGTAPESSFEEVLSKSVGKDTHNVPGCVLAAVDNTGNVFYSKAIGHAGVADDARPIQETDTFWIASCTKLLTSICAVHQVEKGLVDLDEDITRLLPELKTLQIISADESAENGYVLSPMKNKITLRLLLTHTSGIGYEFANPLLRKWRAVNGPPASELNGRVLVQYSAPLLFEPGTSWLYGGGIDWAGIMVERLNNGQTLGSYMEEHIFTPLGMTMTTFELDKRADVKAKLVPAAVRMPDGKLHVNAKPIFAESVKEHSGGGGLWSTVGDYIKVLADLISPEPKILKLETIKNLLAAPQIPADSPALKPLVSARGGAIAANAAAGEAGLNYGLGGMVLTGPSAVLPKGTLSWGGLPNLKWFLNREHGVAAMYASQVLPPGDKNSIALSNVFFAEVMRLTKERRQ